MKGLLVKLRLITYNLFNILWKRNIRFISLGTFQLNIFLVIGWKVGRHDIKLTLFYPDDDRKG